MLALALAQDVLCLLKPLLGLGLHDAGNPLSVADLVADTEVERGQLSAGRRHGVDRAAAAAQQNAFAGYAGWNAAQHAPGKQEGETQRQRRCGHPVERACDADNMVELFGIRKPFDGRFPKDSFRPPFHTGPRKCRTNFDLAGTFSLFQADIACPRGQSFNRPLFETQTFSLLAAWHSRSHAELAHIGPREQLSDTVRSLGRSP